ncbi:hypothetical protein DFH09DRAFT_1104831 [Mycena vulgaris]|nr:hypothetical protein DFH09DRAFT_1104831 [Mycena vulgaris]
MLAATTSPTHHPLFAFAPSKLLKSSIVGFKTSFVASRSLSLLLPDGVGGGAGKPEEGTRARREAVRGRRRERAGCGWMRWSARRGACRRRRAGRGGRGAGRGGGREGRRRRLGGCYTKLTIKLKKDERWRPGLRITQVAESVKVHGCRLQSKDDVDWFLQEEDGPLIYC